VQKNKIAIKDINDSVTRIIKLKEKYALTNAPAQGTDIEAANNIIKNINKE